MPSEQTRAFSSPVKGLSPILNVSSVPQSIEWFERLGWRRGFTWKDGGEIAELALENEHGPAEFGSVCAENATIFMCQDGQGRRADEHHSEGMWITWWIESKRALDEFYGLAVEQGCKITQPPIDEPWGVREFHLQHPDGHIFRCSSGIE